MTQEYVHIIANTADGNTAGSTNDSLVGSILYAITSGMHYMVCKGIPYGHMTMSHDDLICHFYHQCSRPVQDNSPHQYL